MEGQGECTTPRLTRVFTHRRTERGRPRRHTFAPHVCAITHLVQLGTPAQGNYTYRIRPCPGALACHQHTHTTIITMYTRRWTQPRGNNTYDIRPRSRALACKHYAYTYTMGYYVTTICTTGMGCSKKTTSPNMVILRRATRQSPHYIEGLGSRRRLAARAHTERRRRNGGRLWRKRQEWTQQGPVEAFEERRRVGRGCTGRRERNGRPSPDPPERKIDRRPPRQSWNAAAEERRKRSTYNQRLLRHVDGAHKRPRSICTDTTYMRLAAVRMDERCGQLGEGTWGCHHPPLAQRAGNWGPSVLRQRD